MRSARRVAWKSWLGSRPSCSTARTTRRVRPRSPRRSPNRSAGIDCILVLAVSANKDVLGVVAPLAAIADVVYATANDSVRSADPTEIVDGARQMEVDDVQVFPGVAEAIAAARAAAAAERHGPGHRVPVHRGRREASARHRLTIRPRPAPTSPGTAW